MGTARMARKNIQNTREAAIAKAIMEEYQPQTREGCYQRRLWIDV